MEESFIVYDIEDGDLPNNLKQRQTFNAYPTVKDCLGCFSCWNKTPGMCILQDRCSVLPEKLSKCHDLIIISPMTYGGFSRNVKAVLDRSIGYLLPYFRMVHNEMHHKMRYESQFQLHVYFYGNMDEEDKNIAKSYVKAVAINLGATKCCVQFYHNVENIYEVIS